MKRYMIRRVAHCNEGHGKVLDTTENCPLHFLLIPERPAIGNMDDERRPNRLFPDRQEEANFP